MATVYLAEDLRHGRDVAIKVLHPDLGAALGGERFLSEIRTTARLQHPHILPRTLPDTTPHPFTESPEFETGGRFSPDGRWVAYSAETAGLRQVYVSPFPGPGGRVQVSRDGGGLPVWGADSRTLYYPQATRLMAATLSFTPAVTVLGTRAVLEGDYALDDPLHAAFDVAPDGTFLLVRPVREARTVVIRDFRTEIRNQLARQGKQ